MLESTRRARLEARTTPVQPMRRSFLYSFTAAMKIRGHAPGLAPVPTAFAPFSWIVVRGAPRWWSLRVRQVFEKVDLILRNPPPERVSKNLPSRRRGMWNRTDWRFSAVC